MTNEVRSAKSVDGRQPDAQPLKISLLTAFGWFELRNEISGFTRRSPA